MQQLCPQREIISLLNSQATFPSMELRFWRQLSPPNQHLTGKPKLLALKIGRTRCQEGQITLGIAFSGLVSEDLKGAVGDDSQLTTFPAHQCLDWIALCAQSKSITEHKETHGLCGDGDNRGVPASITQYSTGPKLQHKVYSPFSHGLCDDGDNRGVPSSITQYSTGPKVQHKVEHAAGPISQSSQSTAV
ncbi:hypothetical protein HGM15179_019186 [Zosterops borbonicus]|uniref:Uncharacterized protein n=1 Tax=Zosterops borbonicus TaxID=364589 RepID=A0A8K1D8K1_9PASS|nr:hypothetical protein HGM15179_019186 [Zosterops borbonicus]